MVCKLHWYPKFSFNHFFKFWVLLFCFKTKHLYFKESMDGSIHFYVVVHLNNIMYNVNTKTSSKKR